MIDKLGGYEAIHKPKHPVKCVGCGKFIGLDQFDSAHCDYEPLSEYGPERIEWLCGPCVEQERRDDERTAMHGSWTHDRPA